MKYSVYIGNKAWGLASFLMLVSLTICLLNFPNDARAQLIIDDGKKKYGLYTIDNYPRYGTTLNAKQEAELRRFARAIIGGLVLGVEVAVSIHGHADFDAKGRAFELQVSQDRARAAESELRKMLSEEAARVPEAKLSDVRLLVIGNGTANPVHPKPRSEVQRRENRRVEFIYTAVGTKPPPAQQSAFDRCRKVIAQGAPPGPARRINCICSTLERTSPRAKDYTFDFASRQWLAGQGKIPKWTPQQWEALLRGIVIHWRPRVQRDSNTAASEVEFRDSLLTMDLKIGDDIYKFYATTVVPTAMGPEWAKLVAQLDKIVTAEILTNMEDRNHVYSCYKGYSRLRHDE